MGHVCSNCGGEGLGPAATTSSKEFEDAAKKAMIGSHNQPPFDLVIDGNDVSQYVCSVTQTDESRAGWVVHTELTCNHVTSGILAPLDGRKVCVKYRLRAGGSPGPWRSGEAEVHWRVTPMGVGELIVYGRGRLSREESGERTEARSITAKVSRLTLVEGRVIQKEEDEGTITFVKEDPKDRNAREEQLQLADEAQIQAITNPEFILFLASSARLTYNLLYDLGIPQHDRKVTYASFIFLPLAIEYYLKYLLFMIGRELKKEHQIHKLLRLFDFLPFDVQESVENAFRNEVEEIGRDGTRENLRVLLMKSQDAFTAIRYLYDPRYAREYRHLLKPDNIALLTCVLNAVEHVSQE